MNIKGLKQQNGFTLIELMVVVAIIAILAVIAIPSYRQYVLRNAESQAQAKMLQLQIELNRWRATALTYKGFQPRKLASNGASSHGYDSAGGMPVNTVIYVPDGSDSTNYRYLIQLVDGSTGNTLAPTTSGYSTAGNAWKMFAEPSSSYSTGHKILLSSDGLQCKTKNNDSSITVASINCGTYSEDW